MVKEMASESFNSKGEAIIVTDNLAVKLGDRMILEDFSISIKPNRVTVLFGKNGVGKTTLQRSLCGLQKLARGSFTVAGRRNDTLKRRDFAKLVSYIPQSYHPPFKYDVLDFVMMGRAPHGGLTFRPGAKDRSMALMMLEKVGMLDLAYRSYSELSAGERQLILLARGLVQDTPVIFLDEPIANLDFTNQYRVMDTIRSLTQTENKTVIVTLHDPHLSLEYADDFLVLLGPGRHRMFSRQEADYLDRAKETLEGVYNRELDIQIIEERYFVILKDEEEASSC